MTETRMPGLARTWAAAGALASLAAGAWLAAHHPVAPIPASALFALACAAFLLRPDAWLFVVPALVPALGFAPWTGAIAFEEIDLLILAAAAGGYAALAWRGETARVAMPAPASVLVLLFATSLVFGLGRGVAGAATADFGWFDGYEDALNSVRIAKSFAFALLLLPLLERQLARARERAADLLAAGFAAGLAVTAGAVLWERLAFAGLLDFSSSYRVTAPFWEMHVGGAALDGYLALTFPFAVRLLLHRVSAARMIGAGALLLAALYACLVTFSRGVYLALPVSLVLLGFLLLVARTTMPGPAAAAALVRAALVALAMGGVAWLAFRFGGYRSLLASLGAFALGLRLGAAKTGSLREWTMAVVLGAIAGVAAGFFALRLPKGIYANFALAFACCALLLRRDLDAVSRGRDIAARAAYVWVLIAAATLAWGWGGPRALRDSAIVVSGLLLFTIGLSASARTVSLRNWRAQAALVGGAVLVSAVVTVLSGGAFMAGRFGSIERDLDGRLEHWRSGVGMLHGAVDWAVGKGLGRFAQHYPQEQADRDLPGRYRIGERDGNRYLALTGPRRDAGFGEMLRVSQRVPIVPGAPYSVIVDARAVAPAELHVEICEQYLIYNADCAIAVVPVPPSPESVRRIVTLDGSKLEGGPWYARRVAFFSLAVETPGATVDIDEVSVIGADGVELLRNGDFARGMSRWFFTSEWLHLPWHAKNIAIAVLFDQGLAGLLVFALLVAAAVARLVGGAARDDELAPFLAASLVGFVLVGAFDSLLDVPRLAFAFYLLLLLALVLPRASDAATEPRAYLNTPANGTSPAAP